jgi:hypothetical protein
LNSALCNRRLAIVKLPLAGPTILTYAAVQFSGSTIHSQAEIPYELNANLCEVVAMLLEDGDQGPEAEFVGVQTVRVA